MNQTLNFKLSQWDLTDPIKMDDFNTDNRKLEAALTALHLELAQRPKIVFGTYTGDGSYQQEINVGFTPRAVLVFTRSGQSFYVSNSNGYFSGGLALQDHPVDFQKREIVEIIDNGFQVFYHYLNPGEAYSNLNNMVYHYIAFS